MDKLQSLAARVQPVALCRQRFESYPSAILTSVSTAPDDFPDTTENCPLGDRQSQILLTAMDFVTND